MFVPRPHLLAPRSLAIGEGLSAVGAYARDIACDERNVRFIHSI